MWWHDANVAPNPACSPPPCGGGSGRGVALRLAAALALAAVTAGCFQPLYADRTVTGGAGIGQALRGVDVAQIEAANGTPEARMAVEVRDQLLFGLTGGAEQPLPTHRLRVRLASSTTAVIVDPRTGRTDTGNYRLDAVYELTDLRTGRGVAQGSASTHVSFDVPGQEQRFARARGARDAENRAAKVIAEDIKARVASYFASGT